MAVRTLDASDGLAEYRRQYTAGDEPRLSIVVPVYDDPDGIRSTLESVEAAAFEDYEVVVVCTPADGETHRVLRSYAARWDRLTVLTEEEHCTPGAARNVAVERARGDVVCFVDADMTLGPEYLWRVSFLFAETDVDYLGCRVEMVAPDDPSLVETYEREIRFPVRAMMEVLEFCPTCCLSVRASVLEDGLRFAPSLVAAEDIVFGNEVYERGYEVAYCADASVRHPVRRTVREVFDKGVKTGRGSHQVYRRYPERYMQHRYRLLTASAYLPPSLENVSMRCDDWAGLGPVERAAVFLLAYVESLGTSWGYVRELLGEARGSLSVVRSRLGPAGG